MTKKREELSGKPQSASLSTTSLPVQESRDHSQSDRWALLVEDNENDIFFFRRAWGQAALRNPLEIVRSGEDALVLLEERQDRRPSHVFLDLNLPGISGAELIAAIRLKFSGRIVLMCEDLNHRINQVRIAKYECTVIRKPPAALELKMIMSHGW